MIIGFDAKRAFYNRSGLGNYSRNLLNSFFRFYPENKYLLYSPGSKNRIEFAGKENYTLRTPSGITGKLFPSYWRTKGVRTDILKDGAEIYHGLSSELPLSLEGTNVNTFVTVHDLIYMRYPHLYKYADRNIYFRKTIYACRKADRVIAISEQTKEDIIHYTGTGQKKIAVIYQDCNPDFYNIPDEKKKEEVRQKYSLPRNYLLYVGTIEERKNLLSLVKAVEISKPGIPLVVIGKKTIYYKKVHDYIRNKSIPGIIFLENVSNEHLPVIYRLSSCFIYPSVFEGFGIPVIEALVSGTPVITSKGSCFREAGGPGSIYTDPHCPEEIAEAISDVTGDNDKAKKMVIDGYEHVKKFRADIIAGQYMELYRSILQ